jgi:uncharacterized protein YciI
LSARPKEFDHYALVLLRRPSDAPDLPETELDRLQEEHLAYLASLRSRGLVAAGPYRDQPDESLRGMCLFSLSVDEARALMERDPSVRAGRLAVEPMSWLTPKGALTFAPRLEASESS